MRLLTWNCNMAFRNKKEQVLKYNPDILIIQECENPDYKGNWNEFSNWRWIGDNRNKGLGVFSRNDINIEIIDNISNFNSRYILPIKIKEPINLTLLAIWAMNDEEDRKRRYIGQVYTALKKYEDFIGDKSIIAGDFNWNVIWDESPSYSLYGDFTDTKQILNQKELYSIYHFLSDFDFGKENESTFFMHKKKSKSYHIDYIFMNDKLIKEITEFWIGDYEEWIDSSDHMPIMVEL
ncbi:MAG: endonuclease/exonuclease/phosphatase family protein [Bacillota bacterium]